MKALPSIRRRISRAVLAWSLLWSVAVSTAVGLVVHHEMGEMLDERLEVTAQLMAMLVDETRLGNGRTGNSAPEPMALKDAGAMDIRLAWQVVKANRVVLRSSDAPAQPWLGEGRIGAGDTGYWRVFGVALRDSQQVLYVAQTWAARAEEQIEIVLSTALAALAMVLVGYGWVAVGLRRELQPLQSLSDALARHDPLEESSQLGPPERRELAPMHAAVEALGRRLKDRLRREQAFSAHAAHALRTPLAGIDAQLSVALRSAPAELQPRLQRVREAAGRLQRVVVALLALFRTDAIPQRQAIALDDLAQRLLIPGLGVTVSAPATVHADADLLDAALLNLLDNALRHGARNVTISSPQPGSLRLQDDGPGVEPGRRHSLQESLDTQAYDRLPGLGLALADAVARAHDGRLYLPDVASGFAIELRLGTGRA